MTGSHEIDPNADHAGIERGVGLTALMVAAARAIETHRHDPLAQDVYAEHFVRSAPASANWPVRLQDVPDGEANPLWGRLARYFGLRTRVLDDFILESTGKGARQVVLLGAGLDTRAYRLNWPAGCRIYELDRPGILAFKGDVLDELGATPNTDRVAIGADLSADWSDALTGAGFDPTTPCAWLAEGVLFYLPSTAERHVLDTVARLSAPGSAFAYEIKVDSAQPRHVDNPVYSATKEQIGVDLLALFDHEPRPDTEDALTGRGWSTSSHTAFDFVHKYGRGPRPEPNDALSSNHWVFASAGA